MIDCKRQFRFEAAHRIFGHEGACANIHGHSYRVGIRVRTATSITVSLGHLGMIIDFSVIKETIGKWIDDYWDHAVILYEKDVICNLWKKLDLGQLRTHKHYFMTYNPTAENMALHLGLDVCPGLFKGSRVEVTEVTVWETENCCARWTKDGN